MTGTEPLPDYGAWLDRVTATYDAVSYTCRVRLGDAVVAEAVALRVVLGLVARPAVFRHWGLPYSGRIAKLAEDGLADAWAGRPVQAGSWTALRRALVGVDPHRQADFVLVCVDGLDDATLADRWGCDLATAGGRRAHVVDHMRDLAARHGGRAPEGA